MFVLNLKMQNIDEMINYILLLWYSICLGSCF